MTKISIILYLLITMSLVLSAQDDAPGYEAKKFAFADYLFNTRQFEFAAEEYLKLSYDYPHHALLKKRVLESFRLSNNPGDGLLFAKEFFIPDDPSTMIIYPEIVKLKLITHQANIAMKFPLDSSKFHLVYNESKLLDYMISGNWDKVHENADDIKGSSLFTFTQKTPEESYKSPFLASSLSLIIPGSGKVYAGRWKEGLFSFLFVGLTAYQSYRGFRKSDINSVYGWVMGGISFGFYLGNVYGSHKLATDHNNELDRQYVDKVVNHYIHYY